MKSRLLLSIFLCSMTAPLLSAEFYEDKRVSHIEVIIDAPGEEGMDPKPILSRMKTKEGDSFSQTTFDSDLKMLSEEYERVDPSLRVQEGQITIVIHITPKPIIHQIEWKGNEQFKTSTLQKELDINPNTIF